jgi:Protein of unknown function (DUF2961)
MMHDLTDLALLKASESRSISAENPTGAKGGGGRARSGLGAAASRELGVGWKVSPAFALGAGETIPLASIEGPGVIRHIWMTCAPETWRSVILRISWDGEDSPSVEVPLGDFFANGWCERTIVNSLPISAMSGGGLNSYWAMPFRSSALITVENRGSDIPQFFFQVDYSLEAVDPHAAYFHAQWRRSNPVEDGLHTILDGVSGPGHYVGTYLAWQTNNNGWWGEGEVKFFIDGDGEFPTICGTGTEDYVGGAWSFEQVPGQGYLTFTSPYLGFHQVSGVDGFGRSNQRFGMYRWHVPDPVRFTKDLRVHVQALGWRSDGRYLVLKDDIASVATWYQSEPHVPFPPLAAPSHLEVI